MLRFVRQGLLFAPITALGIVSFRPSPMTEVYCKSNKKVRRNHLLLFRFVGAFLLLREEHNIYDRFQSWPTGRFASFDCSFIAVIFCSLCFCSVLTYFLFSHHRIRTVCRDVLPIAICAVVLPPNALPIVVFDGCVTLVLRLTHFSVSRFLQLMLQSMKNERRTRN